MNTSRNVIFSTGLVLVIGGAGAAAADVTAPQVWDGWQSYAATIDPDGNVEALEAGTSSYEDGVLTLGDVRWSFTLPEGTIAGALDQIVMTERDDGTVSIEILGDYALDLDMQPEDAEWVEMRVLFGLSELEVVASGDPDATVYDFGGDSVTMTMDRLVVDGTEMPGVLEVALDAVSGQTGLTQGDMTIVDSSITAERMTALMDISNPDDPGTTATFAADFASVAARSRSAFSVDADLGDPMAFASGDISAEGGYAHGGGDYRISGTGPDGAFGLTVGSSGGSVDFDVDADGMAYSLSSSELDFAISGDQVPMPEMTARAESIEFGVDLPLQPAEAPSDIALRVTLGNIVLGDEVWSMIDPAGMFPHDPATLAIDIAGQGRLTAALDDAEAMTGPVPPVDFETLELRKLELALAGADLTGDGGFDFSEAPDGAVPGMPGVSGRLDFRLVGANALIDRLVQMGLVPEDQAAGARMMLGMVARPAGDDVLESQIEFGADGSITANGQPLQ